MKSRLTVRERKLLIGAAIVLTLASLFLFVIAPLQASIAERRGELAVARANLDLALQAEANAEEIDRRIDELTQSWDSLQLPAGDHQATLMRQLDELQRRAGVRIDGVMFGEPDSLAGLIAGSDTEGAPGSGSEATASAAGSVGLTIKIVGTPAACVDFLARVEALPDVVVIASKIATNLDTAATINGYLVQAPR